ncbi:MAG: MBL fold metallo-hydrolase [Lachnospiraceae bacterium]|nr:MBL fold metallo-hydrolase [Lachnospiraceae bacterium]
MRIVNLMENTEGRCGCLHEHGLSFYIETEKHKLLVDTGASGRFIENAAKLDIDLEAVDLLVLSHGHYDHAGGIMDFVKQNMTAKIYMQRLAGNAYYHKSRTVERYIGIDPDILSLPQLVLLDGDHRIDDELFLYTGVTARRLWPKGNLILKEKLGDIFVQDEFHHEQYLVISSQNKKILISGCAHNGILNILDKFSELYGCAPDYVLSGFHMMKKAEYIEEDMQLIQDVAYELKKMDTKFYTGHCTGEIPYQILKSIMGDQIQYIHSGDCIDIDE